VSCQGCTGYPWLGLVDGKGNRYHERTIAPGEREVIRCTAKTKKQGS